MLYAVYETSSSTEEITVFLCQNYKKISIIDYDDLCHLVSIDWKKY